MPLYKLNQLSMIYSLNDTKLSSCDIYPQARKHRLPSTHSSREPSHAFDLIHVDVWRPYNASTHNGFRYFLTIVDDFSRFTWTRLLSTKGNAFTVLQNFISMAETQFGTKIKCLRSDNAFELGSSFANSQYLLSKGIIHQTSCVATPQQNGIVERKHKHLLETS